MTIVVEQLNHSQFHAHLPDGSGTGVGGWVETVAYALLRGAADRVAVESVALDGTRLVLSHGDRPRVAGGRL